jgi:tRNA nucleotidyltransferase (CCA-adding enzyme)
VRAARGQYQEALNIFYREPELKPSSIYQLLAPIGTEALLVMMAKAKRETARKYISLYLTHLRDAKVSLSGDDLKKAGISPGPVFKKLLSQLLDAKLDGIVKTRDEEIAFVLKKASSLKG